MANASKPSVEVSSEWADIAATATSLASVDVTFQLNAGGPVLLFAGGTTAPADNAIAHTLYEKGDSITLNAANIWGRSDITNSGVLSVSVAS